MCHVEPSFLSHKKPVSSLKGTRFTLYKTSGCFLRICDSMVFFHCRKVHFAKNVLIRFSDLTYGQQL